MRRLRKIVLASLAGILLLAIGLMGLFRWSLQRAQPFYQAAFVTDPHAARAASGRLESEVTALASQMHQATAWDALITDRDVNGWLAVALAEKFPDWLPESVSDLRVAFQENGLLLGFHYQDPHYDTIVSLRMVPFMAEPNVLAIRLEGAHAGSLPIPLEKIVQACREEARRVRFPLRWTRQANCPLALLPIGPVLGTDTMRQKLEKVELSAGQLRIAGKSETIILEIEATP